MPPRDKDSYSIQSVENALDVLEALCEEEDEVRISRLSEKLQMNKTSVFRLLATFESRGYVERKKETGKYKLGLSAYEMGQKLISRMGLLKKSRPAMEKLSRACDEAAYIVVQRGQEVLFLDMADTAQQVKIISLLGKRYPLASNAAGQIFLSYGQLTHPHPGSIEGSSLPQAEQIRQNRYAGETGGLGEGICCLATPLFGTGDILSGCLCLIGPAYRMPPERIRDELLPRLLETGDIISSKLGCHNPGFSRRHI